jgi:hypothetical protein
MSMSYFLSGVVIFLALISNYGPVLPSVPDVPAGHPTRLVIPAGLRPVDIAIVHSDNTVDSYRVLIPVDVYEDQALEVATNMLRGFLGEWDAVDVTLEEFYSCAPTVTGACQWE